MFYVSVWKKNVDVYYDKKNTSFVYLKTYFYRLISLSIDINISYLFILSVVLRGIEYKILNFRLGVPGSSHVTDYLKYVLRIFQKMDFIGKFNNYDEFTCYECTIHRYPIEKVFFLGILFNVISV